MSESLQAIIDEAWQKRAELSPACASREIRDAIGQVLDQLDTGALRIASKCAGEVDEWRTHQWLKKAVLLSFCLYDNTVMEAGGYTQFYDKAPSKFAAYSAADFAAGGFRVAPPAMVRRGAFIAKNVVLMPSYVKSTPGQPSVHARKSGKTCIYRAVSGLAACLSHYRQIQSLSKTTVLSAHARK
jgi:2,3,4,5-tetrahydropyridine-2,6-dicarboxylate N-succinyltransferase